jgi:hypothetical protein
MWKPFRYFDIPEIPLEFEIFDGTLKSLATTRFMFVKIELMLDKLMFFDIAPEITFGMSQTRVSILEFGIIIAIDEFASAPDRPDAVEFDCERNGTPFITEGEKAIQLPGYVKFSPCEVKVLLEAELLKNEVNASLTR